MNGTGSFGCGVALRLQGRNKGVIAEKGMGRMETLPFLVCPFLSTQREWDENSATFWKERNVHFVVWKRGNVLLLNSAKLSGQSSTANLRWPFMIYVRTSSSEKPPESSTQSQIVIYTLTQRIVYMTYWLHLLHSKCRFISYNTMIVHIKKNKMFNPSS